MPPTIMEDFGLDVVRAMDPRNANGCAFLTLDQAARWFTPTERQKLAALGYQFVRLHVERVVAQSAHQALVTRRAPFSHSPEILDWAMLEAAAA